MAEGHELFSEPRHHRLGSTIEFRGTLSARARPGRYALSDRQSFSLQFALVAVRRSSRGLVLGFFDSPEAGAADVGKAYSQNDLCLRVARSRCK
jgi:hypothetical protein